MYLSSAKLHAAVEAGIVSAQQAEALSAFLRQAAENEGPRFRPAHILMYLGGMVAIAALSLFMTVAWETLGGAGMFGLALIYGVVAWICTEWLVRRPAYRLPAGLAATLVAAVVPLAVYGLLHWLNWWPDHNREYVDLYGSVHSAWITLELCTLVVASLLLWRYRLPLLMLPICIAAWFFFIDLLGGSWGARLGEPQAWAGIIYGVLALLTALLLQLRHQRSAVQDLSFWPYLTGSAAVFVGTSWLLLDSATLNWGYLLVNLALIALGTLVHRRSPVVFGGLGLFLLLGYWAFDRFADSLWFPIALSLAGIAIVALGVAWQRGEPRIQAVLDARLPPAWRMGKP